MGLGILNGDVAKSSNSGDDHPVARPSLGLDQATIGGHTGAQQRRGVGKVDAVRQRGSEVGVGHDVLGESAIDHITGCELIAAKRFPHPRCNNHNVRTSSESRARRPGHLPPARSLPPPARRRHRPPRVQGSKAARAWPSIRRRRYERRCDKHRSPLRGSVPVPETASVWARRRFREVAQRRVRRLLSCCNHQEIRIVIAERPKSYAYVGAVRARFAPVDLLKNYCTPPRAHCLTVSSRCWPLTK